MSKELYFKKEALDKIVLGLDKAADAVNGTLGPCGRNVFIDDIYTPKITNDGATIARNITFNDPLENIGAYIIKNVSGQTNDVVGDGTTTTAVLTQAIIHECLKRPENPMEIMRSLQEAGKRAIEILKTKSVPLKKEDYENVALISAENPVIAKMISEIITKLGTSSVVNIEDSKTFQTEYEIVDGYTASVGFLSPHFANSGSRAVFSDVPVFVSQKRISNLQDLSPLFEQFAPIKDNLGNIIKPAWTSSCVIVCEEIDDSILGYFVVSKLKGLFNSVVIRATGETLMDIAGTTGAAIVSDSSGVTFQNIGVDQLGKAKKVITDVQKSIFLGDSVASKLYAQELEDQANGEDNMYVKQKLVERVAKLRGGIANLKIYAPTDFEREYLKLKAEDAVKALQAAIEEGVVEGGGYALLDVSNELVGDTIGNAILKKALKAPIKKIAENAGQEEFLKIDPSIIDPTKVERAVIENSVSAASTFITTSAVIVNEDPIKT